MRHILRPGLQGARGERLVSRGRNSTHLWDFAGRGPCRQVRRLSRATGRERTGRISSCRVAPGALKLAEGAVSPLVQE